MLHKALNLYGFFGTTEATEGGSRYVAHMRQVRNAYTILVERPEGNKPFEKYRCRMEDNIKTDLGQIEYDDVDWTHLPQDRVQ
jgi:hypothetical protein